MDNLNLKLKSEIFLILLKIRNDNNIDMIISYLNIMIFRGILLPDLYITTNNFKIYKF